MKQLLATHKRWLAPLTVLVVAYGVAQVIRTSGPTVEVVTPEPQVLTVRSVTVAEDSVRLSVRTQGEVNARYQIDLVSELAGNVTDVAPAFVTGGYFAKDDVLLTIDPTDYRLAKIRAEASVAEALEELEIEQSEADLASKGLFPLREAKVASAEARLASARAELAQAEADLKRTEVRAPFDGRVLFTTANFGQYLTKGQSLGRIYSTDIAEIRLPLTDNQLRYLSLPFGNKDNSVIRDVPVTLRANVGGMPAEWQGYLHRMEGAVDDVSRVWYAVARVDDPYGLQSAAQEVPLAVGLYVEADIQGRQMDQVFKLPRIALRGENTVLLIDPDNRLRRRTVSVIRTDYDSVVIGDGLQAGDRVCISPVEAFVDGLLVEVVEEPATATLVGN